MRLTVLLVHLVLAALPSPLLAKPTLSSFTSVDCSDIEGSTELCRHCRRAFEAAYPLTPADFRTSFHHDEHAGCAFREVASRLATTSSSSSSDYAASAVKISVIGGSWTAGNHCGDKELGGKKACAWPARLERLLHADGYTNFRVNNAAVPAWAYSNWIESGQLWGLAQSDIVIVDLNRGFLRQVFAFRVSGLFCQKCYTKSAVGTLQGCTPAGRAEPPRKPVSAPVVLNLHGGSVCALGRR